MRLARGAACIEVLPFTLLTPTDRTRGEGSADKTRLNGWPISDETRRFERQRITSAESRVRGKLTHFARSSSATALLLPLFLSFFFLLFFPSSSSFSSSYGAHAGWMTFAENGGFLMALLFTHFISSRVHRRVTRAHRLANSLSCTRILKNNSLVFIYCENQDFGIWPVEPGIREARSGSSKKQTRMNKLLNLSPFDISKENNSLRSFTFVRDRSFVSLIWDPP